MLKLTAAIESKSTHPIALAVVLYAGNVIDKVSIENIEENNIKANVELKGSFCMGQCGKDGVSVKIDDEVYSVTEEDVEMFFEKKILPLA